MIKSTLFV